MSRTPLVQDSSLQKRSSFFGTIKVSHLTILSPLQLDELIKTVIRGRQPLTVRFTHILINDLYATAILQRYPYTVCDTSECPN